MCIVIGLLAGQAVIGKEVAGLAHILARGDVAGIVEVAYSRGVLFHRLFADEHLDRFERAVLHPGDVALHRQRGQTARHHTHGSPLGGLYGVADENAYTVVGFLVQVFDRAALVAAPLEDNE